MPRLLSNKLPKKTSSIKVSQTNVANESLIPLKGRGQKSVSEMSSWEYYNSLMMFGKRKMDRFEWCIWKEKKDQEDWNKKYIMNDEGRYVRRISSKEFNWRIKKDPNFDERFYMIDNKLK